MDKNIFDSISIVTVAKVGSSSFLYSCREKYTVNHGHNLLYFKNILREKKII